MHTSAPDNRLRRIARRLAPLTLVIVLAGCLLPPTPKTDAGQDVFNLYLIVLGLAAIVFVGVEGFILYAVVRYRRKPGDEVLPEQLHGNNTVEVIWTIIPTVIVFILFFFSMLTLGEVEANRTSRTPRPSRSTGFQWQWTFTLRERRIRDRERGRGADPRAPRERAGATRPHIARRQPRDLHPRLPHQARRHRLRRGPGAERADLHDHRGGHVRGPMRRVLRHSSRRHGLRRRREATRGVRGLHRGAGRGRAATAAAGGGDCGTTIQLAAVESIQFDTDAIEAPAGEDFCIEFTNNDTVLHDVGIEETEFNGEDVSPASRSSTSSRPWRPATTPSTAPSIRDGDDR